MAVKSARYPPPLSKDSLLELYGQTHAKVHRGNVEKLLKSATPIDMNPQFPENSFCRVWGSERDAIGSPQ